MDPRLQLHPFADRLPGAGQRTDFCLVLDERGTPGTDREFVTGGLLAYGDIATLEAEAGRFFQDHNLRRVKGTKLDEDQRLAVVQFLLGRGAVPVAVHSVLDDRILELTRDAARRYAALSSPHKVAEKIAPSSWIWKTQMNHTIAMANVTAIACVGPIGRFAVKLERISDSDEMKAHYRSLLEDRMTPEGRCRSVPGIPAAVVDYAAAANGTDAWSLDLEATGPLSVLADFVCAMYGRHREGRTNAWRDLAVEFQQRPNPRPVCLGVDATSAVVSFLEGNAATLRSPQAFEASRRRPSSPELR